MRLLNPPTSNGEEPKLFDEILKEEHEVIFQKGGRYSTFEAIWESILKAISTLSYLKKQHSIC